MSGFGFPYIARIIITENIRIPDEIVHFENLDFEQNFYIDIPLNILSIENIRNDLKNYHVISDLRNEDNLSDETKVFFNVLNKIEVKSFLIESFTDFNPNYWIEDLIQIVIENKIIVEETKTNTVNEDGDLYSDFYGYTNYEILYRNYKEAKEKYEKNKK